VLVIEGDLGFLWQETRGKIGIVEQASQAKMVRYDGRALKGIERWNACDDWPTATDTTRPRSMMSICSESSLPVLLR
jgi:hypothetical protein